MKIDTTRLLLIGILIACIGAACTPRPRPGIAAFPKQRAAADELFQRAEKQYAAKSYAEALTLYNDYLARYPDEPLAPAALMKIGSIHSLLGSPARGRLAYAQLIVGVPVELIPARGHGGDPLFPLSGQGIQRGGQPRPGCPADDELAGPALPDPGGDRRCVYGSGFPPERGRCLHPGHANGDRVGAGGHRGQAQGVDPAPEPRGCQRSGRP